MLNGIAQARTEVLLEMYWFASDATGREFAEALKQRASEGLRVCVTYDAVGSWEADRQMFDEMRAAGCHVYEYNPPLRFLSRFQWWRMHRRNHRKMLILDGQVGFVGGVNLGDPWAPPPKGDGFRDDIVRVRGPAALVMRDLFRRTFVRGRQGRDLLIDGPAPSLAADSPETSQLIRVLSNQGLGKRRTIEREYLRNIRRAQHSVLITNSYFIPRTVLRRALAAAVRRGVNVHLLLPGTNDVPAVGHASKRLYGWLLRRGIHVHHWHDSVLHAKTAVVDDRWCTVGTHNLDHRSLLYNLEVNITIEDATVASELADKTRFDIERSSTVTLDDWKYRPLSERLLEWFFFRFRRLM